MTRLWEILKASKGLSHEPFACLAAQSMAGGKVAELSGIPPLSFLSNGKPLVEYQIDGKFVQNGIPTHESPIDIQGTGDRTTNLFDAVTAYGNLYSNGAVSGTTISISQIKTYFTAAQIGKQITISIHADKVTASRIYIRTNIADSVIDSNSIYTGSTGTMLVTITPQSIADYWCVTYGSNANDECILSSIMLNLGSTVLPYEPYGYKIPISSNGTTTAIYLNSPLYGTGDVLDEYDSTGKLTREWGKYVFDGSEFWSVTTSSLGQTRAILNSSTGYIVQNSAVYSTHYRGVSGGGGYPENGTAIVNANGTLILSAQNVTTVEEWKSYLSAQYAAGTPVTVVYQLATPTEEAITAPQINTVKGTNILSVDTAVQPSNVKIKYNQK